MVIIEQSKLQGGDVLLCSSSSIEKNRTLPTNSKYYHAAICLNNKVIAESSASGVKKSSLQDILEEYGHIAVLRNNNVWSSKRLSKLNTFIDKIIRAKVLFNHFGLGRYECRKKYHDQTIHEQLELFFKKKLDPILPQKDVYFCSELIVSAFIVVGIIDHGLAVVLKPEVYAPWDIGAEPTFGNFIGYLIPYEDYEIDQADEFYFQTPIDYS